MTLAQAIEKVGVGGKVKFAHEHIVLYVGDVAALLKDTLNNNEWSEKLERHDCTPVLPKKRVVLQAWEDSSQEIRWFVLDADYLKRSACLTRREDIPNMIFEDGKQVFDADA